jgi:hypothetical protein
VPCKKIIIEKNPSSVLQKNKMSPKVSKCAQKMAKGFFKEIPQSVAKKTLQRSPLEFP